MRPGKGIAFCVLTIALLITGCAATPRKETVLTFPAAGEVKTACIVALVTNTKPDTEEQGFLGAVNDAAMIQGMAKNRMIMEKIAKGAYEDYLSGMVGWGHWKIIDFKTFSQTRAARQAKDEREAFVERHQTILGATGFQSHPALIPFAEHSTSPEVKTQELARLGSYASLCNADAAIALDIRVAYGISGGLNIMGRNVGGDAKAVVDHRMFIADRSGREVGDIRTTVTSASSVPMISGAVVLDDTFVQTVRETNGMAVREFTQHFSRELAQSPK